MATWVTVCDTCKRDGWETSGQRQSDGEVLAALIEDAAAATPVKVRRFSCLMGCSRACNVTVQGAGKVNYSIGAFEPDSRSAKAIVEYAAMHDESKTGVVPYRQWPQPIKGHFVSRHPSLPEND